MDEPKKRKFTWFTGCAFTVSVLILLFACCSLAYVM